MSSGEFWSLLLHKASPEPSWHNLRGASRAIWRCLLAKAPCSEWLRWDPLGRLGERSPAHLSTGDEGRVDWSQCDFAVWPCRIVPLPGTCTPDLRGDSGLYRRIHNTCGSTQYRCVEQVGTCLAKYGREEVCARLCWEQRAFPSSSSSRGCHL